MTGHSLTKNGAASLASAPAVSDFGNFARSVWIEVDAAKHWPTMALDHATNVAQQKKAGAARSSGAHQLSRRLRARFDRDRGGATTPRCSVHTFGGKEEK